MFYFQEIILVLIRFILSCSDFGGWCNGFIRGFWGYFDLGVEIRVNLCQGFFYFLNNRVIFSELK